MMKTNVLPKMPMLKKTAQKLEEFLLFNGIHIEIREVNIQCPSTEYAFEFMDNHSLKDIRTIRKSIIIALNPPIKKIRICSTKKGLSAIYIPNPLIN
jgi:hypothetical protein